MGRGHSAKALRGESLHRALVGSWPGTETAGTAHAAHAAQAISYANQVITYINTHRLAPLSVGQGEPGGSQALKD